MADSDSVKKVLVGGSLQAVRKTPETGPADSFIIPASKFVMNAKREFSLLNAENAQWKIGAVPLGYSVPFPLTIYGFPEKSFLGELMAMAIGPGTISRLNSVGLARFVPSVPGTPGLNDATAGGAYTGAADVVYTIEVAASASPDTVKIKKGTGAYGSPTPITSGAITVGDGVTITFTALTGHTAGDIWKIKCFNSLAYRHTFEPADIPEVATMWQSERAGQLIAGDVVCNKLTFKIDQNKEMQVTGDLIGGSIAIANDMGVPVAGDYPAAEDSDHIFRSGIATLNYGQSGAAIQTNLRTIDISIDRGIKPEEGRTQDAVSNANAYPEQNLLTLSLEFLLTNLQELQRSWDGVTATAPSATSPDWTETRLPSCNLLLRPPAKICTMIDSARPAAGNTSPSDVETSGTFTGDADAVYTIKISTAGTPDKFQVKKDSGAYGAEISVTGSAQSIGDGISVTFGATTGHVQNDTFTIAAKVNYYELELAITDASVQFTPDQTGGRRTGKIELTPIATPADLPYRMFLTNSHSAAYT